MYPGRWLFLALGLLVAQSALATPKFMVLPYNQDNVVLQQGWTYMDGGTHRGIDWQRNWQPFNVYACHDGDATYFGGCSDNDNSCNGGLGNYVRIRKNIGGVDYYTLYCHLQSSPLSGTQSVAIGQLIGVTGITGAANGVNHLHFEYHEESVGNKKDPYDIYGNRDSYPPNGGSCGANYSWTTCPPTMYTFLCSPQTATSTISPVGPYKHGQLIQVTVKFKNEGTATWSKTPGTYNFVELASCGPTGQSGLSFFNYRQGSNPETCLPVEDVGWRSCIVPDWFDEATVAPGGTATFTFPGRIKPNASLGTHEVYFAPFHEGTAMAGWNAFHFTVTVVADPNPVAFDFDGDKISDVWDRTSTGQFHLDTAANNLTGWDITREGYGGSQDIPCPAHYDGDGKCDFAVLWNSDRSLRIDFAYNGFGAFDRVDFLGYGDADDYPCPCDYDGDHIDDISVRGDDGYWRIDYFALQNGFGAWDGQYGQGAYGGIYDRPAPADYNGDGKCDLAILRNSDRKFLIDWYHNGLGTWDVTNLGGYGGFADYPCPADYDNDGQKDIAILWTSTRVWWVDEADDGFGSWNYPLGGYGGVSDRPMPADYDGDGKDDIACYHVGQDRICIDYFCYQGNCTYGSWDWCDGGAWHPTWRVVIPQEEESTLPTEFSVSQNYPNPFNPVTTINYALPTPMHVKLDIYNVLGQKVITLVDEQQPAGQYTTHWDGRDCSSGVYFYRLVTDQATETKKMVLLK